MKNLAGRVAAITGAGSGIGRGAALSLASRGVDVIVADIDSQAGAETCALIVAAGGRATFVESDVREHDAFVRLREVAVATYGRVDIVMNNVGIIVRGYPEQIPIEAWQKVFDVNFLSMVRSNAAFVPHFIGAGEGHVVNTASFAGLFTYSFDRVPYAATKAAVVQMTEALAIYLKPLGVGVTLLCPGPVATNIARSIESLPNAPPLRSPGKSFQLLSADIVGEQVAHAIETDQFMLATDPTVFELLEERARDWDAFIDGQINAADVRL